MFGLRDPGRGTGSPTNPAESPFTPRGALRYTPTGRRGTQGKRSVETMRRQRAGQAVQETMRRRRSGQAVCGDDAAAALRASGLWRRCGGGAQGGRPYASAHTTRSPRVAGFPSTLGGALRYTPSGRRGTQGKRSEETMRRRRAGWSALRFGPHNPFTPSSADPRSSALLGGRTPRSRPHTTDVNGYRLAAMLRGLSAPDV